MSYVSIDVKTLKNKMVLEIKKVTKMQNASDGFIS